MYNPGDLVHWRDLVDSHTLRFPEYWGVIIDNQPNSVTVFLYKVSGKTDNFWNTKVPVISSFDPKLVTGLTIISEAKT